MGRETKTAQKTSRIKGYNRRLMHFIEKTVFALWTVLYYHGFIKSARTSGRFLWKFCLVERFTSRCPSRELYQGNLSRRRKTGLGIKNNMVDTAWFIGFYEQNNLKVFFAVRLNDKKNSLKDYRHLASIYAKQIALDIIQNANIF